MKVALKTEKENHSFITKTRTVDTLMLARILKNSGVSEKQAEVQAEVISEVLATSQERDNLATKQDLEVEIAKVNSTLEIEIAKVNSKLEVEIAKVNEAIAIAKFDMIKWTAGLMIAQTGVIFALIKFFVK
jgi:hypothetical protein